MNELKGYKERTKRHYKEYKSPRFWTFGFIWQFILLIVMGLWFTLFND